MAMVMMLLEERLFIQRTEAPAFVSYLPPHREIHEENSVSVVGPECTRTDALHSHGNTAMGIQPVKLTYTKVTGET